MSIIDKLPEAPAGYKWSTGVGTSREGEVYASVILGLDYGPTLPVVSVGSLYASTLPTEEAILEAAKGLLEKFWSREEEDLARREEQKTLSEQYAHLLTD